MSGSATLALLYIKPHTLSDLGVIQETGLLDVGIRELQPPEALFTVAGTQRLPAEFWSQAIVFVRFDHHGVVNMVTRASST